MILTRKIVLINLQQQQCISLVIHTRSVRFWYSPNFSIIAKNVKINPQESLICLESVHHKSKQFFDFLHIHFIHAIGNLLVKSAIRYTLYTTTSSETNCLSIISESSFFYNVCAHQQCKTCLRILTPRMNTTPSSLQPSTICLSLG